MASLIRFFRLQTLLQTGTERMYLLILSVLFCFLSSIANAAFVGETVAETAPVFSQENENLDSASEDSEGPELTIEDDQSIATALASRSVARLAYQAERMISRRELDEALTIIEYGLEIDPSYIPLWRLQAMAHIELGQNEEAKTALSVCLLLNPNDVDARAMSLINDIREKGLGERERMLRLVDGINDMDKSLFSKIVARFAGRRDFHEELPAFLQGWRRSDEGLNGIREALNQYAGGQVEEAEKALRGMPDSTVPAGVLPTVRKMIETALDPEDISGWKVEQGELTRNQDMFTLTSKPERQTFAWLRLSQEWRDVAVTVSFPPAENNVQTSLYLRYMSPESYLRLTTRDGMLLVQERIADFGLSTILQHPLSQFSPHPLHVILCGNRLSLLAANETLIEPPLPIAEAIDSGRVALACDNTANDNETSVVFPELRIRRLTPHWRRLSADMTQQFITELFSDESLTGVTVNIGEFAATGRRALPALLLDASSRGMMTIGELQAGDFNFDHLHRTVSHLPKVLAERIWTAAAFTPTSASNWPEVASALSDARQKGLGSVLVLDEDTAGSLARFEGDLWADWLRLDTSASLPDAVTAALAKRYTQSIRRDASDPSRFSP